MKNYPKWLNIRLWERLLEFSNKAGKPMSDDKQRAAIAKLKQMIKSGQNQEKVLHRAIDGIYKGLGAAKGKPIINMAAYKQGTPVKAEKSKNVEMVNNSISEMRKKLR